MGLDMFFEKFPANATEDKLNTSSEDAEKLSKEDKKELESLRDAGKEIQYFRKHSDLHGWLTEKWLEKHPEEDNFNCLYLEITPELLAEMTEYANQIDHERYQGFFWGESYPEDWEDTRKLCERIKDILDEGNKVFYTSWW